MFQQVELSSPDWDDVVGGSGRLQLEGRGVSLSSGSLPNSWAIRRLGGANMITPGSRFDRIDWSQPIALLLDVSVGAASPAGFSQISLGKLGRDGLGDLVRPGVGFRLAHLQPQGLAHNGAISQVIDLGPPLTATQAYRLLILSNGRGRVIWSLNGSLGGTTEGGPTGLGGVDESYFHFEVANGPTGEIQALHIAYLGLEAPAGVSGGDGLPLLLLGAGVLLLVLARPK